MCYRHISSRSIKCCILKDRKECFTNISNTSGILVLTLIIAVLFYNNYNTDYNIMQQIAYIINAYEYYLERINELNHKVISTYLRFSPNYGFLHQKFK